MATYATLPPLGEQARRLVELGVHEIAGLDAGVLRAAAADGRAEQSADLLVVHHGLVPASALVPLLTRGGKSGFVVADLTDVDEFSPIDEAAIPDSPLYTVHNIDRGDELANQSPDEALPVLNAAGRTPLVLTEGLHWLLQQPDALERNHCFMTIGSRRRRPTGQLDARTPAIWLSNGTGRDGAARRDAPKVGWCWAGNRHTWLGFASATRRDPRPTEVTHREAAQA